MTAITHNVTTDDVLDALPMASGNVTPTSQGLNTSMVDRWIRAGARRVNSVVRSYHGIDVDALEQYEVEVLRDGIVAYARYRCLEARDYDDTSIDRARDDFQDILQTIRRFPADLDSDDPSTRIRGSSSDAEKQWTSDNFGGW